MAKANSVQFFRAGDSVTFEGRPKRGIRPTVTGVVTDGPKGKHSYYGVSTSGGQFKVPAKLLKPGKVDKKLAKVLAENGEKFKARKEANVARRDERQLKDCQHHIESWKLVRGMAVKNRGVQGWPVVTILEVDHENGKCQVETSTAVLQDKLDMYKMATGFELGRRICKRRTTWVLANRLYPADAPKYPFGGF
jgi:hypothetical protein